MSIEHYTGDVPGMSMEHYTGDVEDVIIDRLVVYQV